MKQITIEIPDNKRAVWKDDKLVLVPALPKTWEEFCNQHRIKVGEAFIDNSSGIKKYLAGADRVFWKDRNILPNEKATRQHLALMQLHQLRDCYCEGWEPNPGSGKEWYTITLWNGEPIVSSTRRLVRFLSFPTLDLADEFKENFKDLILEAGIFLSN